MRANPKPKNSISAREINFPMLSLWQSFTMIIPPWHIRFHISLAYVRLHVPQYVYAKFGVNRLSRAKGKREKPCCKVALC